VAPSPGQEEPVGKPRNLVALPDDYVQFQRLPQGGVQPLLAVDAAGEPHLVYLRPAAHGADLYATRSRDGAPFPEGLRVNGRDGSVALLDGRHGAAFALGADGRQHVLWVGSGAEPALLYARSTPDGDGFEPERVLATPPGLGCGPALAVGGAGHVFVFYAAHGSGAPGDAPGDDGSGAGAGQVAGAEVAASEPRGRIFMLRSGDGGGSFLEPVAIDEEKHAVSMECSLAAIVDKFDDLFVFYRAAMEPRRGESKAKARDMRMLSSTDGGDTFDSVLVSNWKAQRDPRSSCSLSQGPHRVLAAWEGNGQVFWSHVVRDTRKVSIPLEPRQGSEDFTRSRPVAISNAGNEVLLAWLQRPAGTQVTSPDELRVAWQVWDKSRNLPLGNGQAPDPAGTSWPVAFARADGGFVVVY
jgi:hypothetical protein